MITGAGGLRQWSVFDKARVIAETLEPSAVISEVARRYGIRPQQVFAWRRKAGKQGRVGAASSAAFVPAIAAAEPVARHSPDQRKRQATRDAGMSMRSMAARCASAWRRYQDGGWSDSAR
ncbi:transposase [Mesorhizobium album]|uniref:transposase n=1 Tax=Mesorhizobium album TaxID=3072314 RepID=UPI003D3108CE